MRNKSEAMQAIYRELSEKNRDAMLHAARQTEAGAGTDVVQRLGRLMAERGWSVCRLAREAGLSPHTVRSIFRRGSVPRVSTLEALCRALDVPLAEFFRSGGSGVYLTERQEELLRQWEQRTAGQRAALLCLMDCLAQKPRK